MPNRFRRLTALAVLTLPVMLAGCELLRLTPEPAPAPAQEAPPPPAPAVEPPPPVRPAPLPGRKPPLPAPPSAAQPAPAVTPAEEALPRPPVVVGLTRDGLVQQFGPPVAEREAAPARVLEFGGADCRLAAYLYFDTTRNDFYALQYEVNGIPAPHDAVDRCLSRIARDASRR
ncbi:MAG: hypothetical protein KG075_10715 [Alphaproteobacteria bacterium]|nr:hypothetical protein [Alphaproteobacteria bacterium]